MNTSDVQLISLRLSRLAKTAAWLFAAYVAWTIISLFVAFLVWLKLVGTSGIFAIPLLYSLPLALQILLPACAMLFFYGVAIGVKKRSKIMLCLNMFLISFAYIGIAALCVYGLSNLPAVYAEQAAAGAQKGWLAVFIAVAAVTAAFIAFSFIKRWYLHLLATKFLFLGEGR